MENVSLLFENMSLEELMGVKGGVMDGPSCNDGAAISCDKANAVSCPANVAAISCDKGNAVSCTGTSSAIVCHGGTAVGAPQPPGDELPPPLPPIHTC